MFATIAAILMDPAAPAIDLRQLSWMTGAWRATTANGTTWDEVWMAPATDTVQGVGRESKDGKTLFTEAMMIERAADGKITLFMTLGRASKGARTPEPFPMTSMTKNEVVFSRTGDDFPSVIRYRSLGKDRMECVISGKLDGKDAKEVFAFRRV